VKILNLYAGIGGNRKLWGEEHLITAVENNEEIAFIYQDFFPDDKVVVKDAHNYLLNHFEEFDFIWSSPPCPTHSRMRFNHDKKVFPDFKLYEEIVFLKHYFKRKFVVENVVGYYKPLIKPQKVGRHYFWGNFFISEEKFDVLETCKMINEREFLEGKFGFDLSRYSGVDKRLLLRNCVEPELGEFVLDCALKQKQTVLGELK